MKSPVIKILLVLLLVWVVGVGIFLSKKKSITWNEPLSVQSGATTEDTTESVPEVSLYEAEQQRLEEKQKQYDTYNTAVDTLDPTVCEKIIGNDKLKAECLDNVYSAQASKEKDVKLCEKITDTTTKDRCVNSFVYDTAIASAKQSDCDKIVGDSDLKSACEKNIVFAKIEEQSFSGTVDVCNTLAGADKDYCVNRIKKDSDIDLLQKGTNTKDISICGQIQDINMKNTCSDTVYMSLAIEKKDGSLCTKIVDVNRRTNCIAQFARVNDVSLLQKALAENNLSLCTTITTPDLKIKCTDTILLKQWVANRDATLCAKITDASTKKQCTDAVKLILEQTSK